MLQQFVTSVTCNKKNGGDKMAEKDTMTRKWQITINNPRDKGMTHEYIAQKVGEM